MKLGVTIDGIHSAEALLLARYFMYEQVYFHHVRRAYDAHLVDFMREHYGSNGYMLDPDFHLSQTDYEVLAAIRAACRNTGVPGYGPAKAIYDRKHFRMVYSRSSEDEQILISSFSAGKMSPTVNKPLTPAYYIRSALEQKFGADKIKQKSNLQDSIPISFPVLMHDNRISEASNASMIFAAAPRVVSDYLFSEPGIASVVRTWIDKNRDFILAGEYAP